MDSRRQIDIKPWMLPILVALLVIPIAVAWALGGPGFGLLAGGALAAVVVIVAIRTAPRGNPPADDRGPFAAEVHTRQIGEATVISAAGEVESEAGRELGDALREAAVRDHEPVLVDLTEARVIDATAVGVLLNGVRRLTRQGRQLSIIVPPGPVRRSLELAGLVDTFILHPTLQAALAEAENELVRLPGSRRQRRSGQL